MAKRATKKRYSLNVDERGRLVCTDTKTGKPVGLDRCTTVGVDRDADALTIRFNKSKCSFAPNAEKEFVERAKAGKLTNYVYAPDDDERRE